MFTIVDSDVIEVHACAKLLHLVHYLEIGRPHKVCVVTLILYSILFMKVPRIIHGKNEVD